MRIRTKPDATVVASKGSLVERFYGLVMLALAGVIAYFILAMTEEYNFWIFTATIFLLIFLALPGFFLFAFRHFVEINPKEKSVGIHRGWVYAPAVARYDFAEIKSILLARLKEGKLSEGKKRLQIILRVEEGGIVLSSPDADCAKIAALAEMLSNLTEKPVERVKEREDGDGFTAED